MDVDRLDYLIRDSYFSGLKFGLINSGKILDYIMPYKDKTSITLGYSEKIIPYIRDFLFSRISMYVNCYEHPVKLASERMLIKALEYIYEEKLNKNLNLDDLMLLTDQQLINFIIHTSNSTDISFKLINSIGSGNIFKLIKTYNLEDIRDVAEVDQFLRDRRKRLGEVAYLKDVNNLENRIISYSGMDEENSWKVALYFPSPESISRSLESLINY